MNGVVQELRRNFLTEKSLLRKNEAAREPLLPAWLRLAHHAPLSRESLFQTFKSFNHYASFTTLTKIVLRRSLEISEWRRYWYWLFERKKRSGLSVLTYMITSKHVHLLIKDTPVPTET
jgi:hypothetical protein